MVACSKLSPYLFDHLSGHIIDLEGNLRRLRQFEADDRFTREGVGYVLVQLKALG